MAYREGPFERIVNVGWVAAPSMIGVWQSTSPGFLANLPVAVDPNQSMGTYVGRNPCSGLLPPGWPLNQPFDLGGGALIYGSVLYIPATPPVFEIVARFSPVLSAPPPPPFADVTIRGLTSGAEISWSGTACRDNTFGFGNTRERPVGGDFYSVGVPHVGDSVFYRGVMRTDPGMIIGETIEAF